MNYHQKYFKYKTKYLELLKLKKIQNGGNTLSEEQLKEINDIIINFQFNNQYNSSSCDKFMNALKLGFENEVELTYNNYTDYIQKYLDHIATQDTLSKLNITEKINIFLGCYILWSKDKDKAKQYIINIQDSINAPTLTVTKKQPEITKAEDKQQQEITKAEDKQQEITKVEDKQQEITKVEDKQQEIDLIKNRLKEIEEEHEKMRKEHEELILKLKNHSHSIVTTGMEIK